MDIGTSSVSEQCHHVAVQLHRVAVQDGVCAQPLRPLCNGIQIAYSCGRFYYCLCNGLGQCMFPVASDPFALHEGGVAHGESTMYTACLCIPYHRVSL